MFSFVYYGNWNPIVTNKPLGAVVLIASISILITSFCATSSLAVSITAAVAAVLAGLAVKLLDRLRKRDAETEARRIVERAEQEAASRTREAELEIKEKLLREVVEKFREGENPVMRSLLLRSFAAQAAIDWPVLEQLVFPKEAPAAS